MIFLPGFQQPGFLYIITLRSNYLYVISPSSKSKDNHHHYFLLHSSIAVISGIIKSYLDYHICHFLSRFLRKCPTQGTLFYLYYLYEESYREDIVTLKALAIRSICCILGISMPFSILCRADLLIPVLADNSRNDNPLAVLACQIKIFISLSICYDIKSIQYSYCSDQNLRYNKI